MNHHNSQLKSRNAKYSTVPTALDFGQLVEHNRQFHDITLGFMQAVSMSCLSSGIL